jgi:two-component system, NtrC family, sensor kinase
MLNELLKSNIAIIGGGEFCKHLLQLLFSDYFKEQRPSILGVADKNVQAEGFLYAEKIGIFTTSDYQDLYQLENLQILMGITTDVKLGALINATKPGGIKFIDHVESRTIWTSLQVEKEKRKGIKRAAPK